MRRSWLPYACNQRYAIGVIVIICARVYTRLTLRPFRGEICIFIHVNYVTLQIKVLYILIELYLNRRKNKMESPRREPHVLELI